MADPKDRLAARKNDPEFLDNKERWFHVNYVKTHTVLGMLPFSFMDNPERREYMGMLNSSSMAVRALNQKRVRRTRTFI